MTVTQLRMLVRKTDEFKFLRYSAGWLETLLNELLGNVRLADSDTPFRQTRLVAEKGK